MLAGIAATRRADPSRLPDAGITLAQDCTARYAFDGTLTDRQGGHDGTMITGDGASAVPEFVPGQSGQALVLGERTVMRDFLDLHPNTCPEPTISAWLRVDPGESGARVVVSGGNPQSPGLRVSGGTLTVNGPAHGLSESSVFRPQGGWALVAGVYDFRRGTYTLYWRGRSKTSDRRAQPSRPPSLPPPTPWTQHSIPLTPNGQRHPRRVRVR